LKFNLLDIVSLNFDYSKKIRLTGVHENFIGLKNSIKRFFILKRNCFAMNPDTDMKTLIKPKN